MAAKVGCTLDLRFLNITDPAIISTLPVLDIPSSIHERKGLGLHSESHSVTGYEKKTISVQGEQYQGFVRPIDKTGKFVSDRGNMYVGCFQHGKPSGIGTLSHKIVGSVTQGIFEGDGFIRGPIAVISAEAHFFLGRSSLDNSRIDTGQLTDSRIHASTKGQFKEGTLHGLGYMSDHKTEFCKGVFTNGGLSGQGWVKYIENRSKDQEFTVYCGDLYLNSPHGFGVYYFPDGEIYEGESVHGRRDGLSVHHTSKTNGVSIYGACIYGIRQGKTRFCHESGKYQDVLLKDNKKLDQKVDASDVAALAEEGKSVIAILYMVIHAKKNP